MTLVAMHLLSQKLLLPVLISLQINNKHNQIMVSVSYTFYLPT